MNNIDKFILDAVDAKSESIMKDMDNYLSNEKIKSLINTLIESSINDNLIRVSHNMILEVVQKKCYQDIDSIISKMKIEKIMYQEFRKIFFSSRFHKVIEARLLTKLDKLFGEDSYYDDEYDDEDDE